MGKYVCETYARHNLKEKKLGVPFSKTKLTYWGGNSSIIYYYLIFFALKKKDLKTDQHAPGIIS